MTKLKSNETFYFFTIHPNVWDEIAKTATARERWKMKYRNERIKRRGGVPQKILGVIGEWRNVTVIE